jgi:hypothetical protein
LANLLLAGYIGLLLPKKEIDKEKNQYLLLPAAVNVLIDTNQQRPLLRMLNKIVL